jgi:uncharacterized integral membrane protein
MNSSAARFALTIAGALALLMGLIFAGQGANLIPGSFMTGDSTWLIIGIILAVVGAVLLVVALRRRPRE